MGVGAAHAKMTQEPLAAAAGLGRSTVARIESGEPDARYDTLIAVAAAMSRPLADFLTGYEGERRAIRTGRD